MLTVRIWRRSTVIDKRRVKVRLFSVSQLESPTRLLDLALACLLLLGARTHLAASPAPKHTRYTQKMMNPCRGNRGRMTL